MNEALHIAARFVEHFAAATALVLWGFMGLRTLTRRTRSEWLSGEWKHTLLLAGLTVFAFAALREAYDVHNGQTLTKAVFDYASWFLGAGTAGWSLYRFRSGY